MNRTPDELAEAIRSLSAAEWIRVRKAANALARCKPIEAEDLLQEAFLRAFDGSRNCPPHVDVVRFITESMRSIASGELDKIKRRPPLVPIANYGNDQSIVDPPDPGVTVEQRLASNEQRKATETELLNLFEDDPVAQTILVGMILGMRGEELREQTNLDKTAYQTKRRLIRRRVEKKFADGWTP